MAGKGPPVLAILVAVAIVLVAVVAVGYPQRAVSIVMRIARTVYTVNESVNFTLILKVEGNQPVGVWSLPGPLCGNLYFVVEDEREKTIYPEVGGQIPCPLMQSRLLQPGETLSFNFTWNQVNRSGSPVPVGHRYLILGAFRELDEAVRVFAGAAWIFVSPPKSNT